MFAFCCGLLGTLNWSFSFFFFTNVQEGTKELNLNNMLSLSMDGPAVNWKFVELLQEEHREQCGGAQLQIIGSCGLHTMHNSFKNGFAVWQVEKVLKALHYLFHCASARRRGLCVSDKVWYISSAILRTSMAGKPSSSGASHWNLAIYCHLCGSGQSQEAPQSKVIVIWHHRRSPDGSLHLGKVTLLHECLKKFSAISHQVPDRCPDDSLPRQRFGGSNQGRPNDY